MSCGGKHQEAPGVVDPVCNDRRQR